MSLSFLQPLIFLIILVSTSVTWAFLQFHIWVKLCSTCLSIFNLFHTYHTHCALNLQCIPKFHVFNSWAFGMWLDHIGCWGVRICPKIWITGDVAWKAFFSAWLWSCGSAFWVLWCEPHFFTMPPCDVSALKPAKCKLSPLIFQSNKTCTPLNGRYWV